MSNPTAPNLPPQPHVPADEETLARITLLCDAAGIVESLCGKSFAHDTLAAADSSTELQAAAAAIGKTWHTTFWFDHLDFDQREAARIQKSAAQGIGGEARVWVRVAEHQLVRADLTVEPLVTPLGPVKLLIRTSPTLTVARRKPGQSIETKTLQTLIDSRSQIAEASNAPVSTGTAVIAGPPSPTDLLSQRVPIAIFRADLETGRVIGVNDALLDLMGVESRNLIGSLLTDLIHMADRPALSRGVSQLFQASTGDLLIDTRLPATPTRGDLFVRLSLLAEAERKTALGFVRDVTHERGMLDLIRKADELSHLSRRSDGTLRRLEEVIANSPAGVAVFQSGRSVLKNRAFRQIEDAHAFEESALLSALAAKHPCTIEPTTSIGAKLFVFPLEVENDAELVGVMAILPELARGSGLWVRIDQPFLESLAFAAAVVEIHDDSEKIALSNTHFTMLLDTNRDGANLPPMHSIPMGVAKWLRLSIPQNTDRKDDSQRVWQDAISGSPVATLLLDAESRVHFANPAAVTFLANPTVVGMSVEDVLPVTGLSLVGPDASARGSTVVYRVLTVEATRVEIEISVHPTASGCVMFVTDTSQRRAAEHSIARASLFSRALASPEVTVGVIEWDVQNGSTTLSNAARQMLGHLPDEPLGWASAFNQIDVQDKVLLEAAIYESLDQPKAYPMHLRLHRGPKTLDISAVVEWSSETDDTNEPAVPRRMLVLIRDITVLLQTAREMEAAHTRLRERSAEVDALIEAVPGSVLLTTTGQRRFKGGDANSMLAKPDSIQLPAGSHIAPATQSQPERAFRIERRPVVIDGIEVGQAVIELDESELTSLRQSASLALSQLDALFNHPKLLIALVSQSGKLKRLSKSLNIMLRTPNLSEPDATVETHLSPLTFDDLRSEQSISSRLPLSANLLTRDNTNIPVEITSSECGADTLIVLNDVSERVAREQIAADAEARAQLLQTRLTAVEESIYDAVFLLDSSGLVIQANYTARQLLDLDDDITFPVDAFGKTLWRDDRKRRLAESELPWHRAVRGQRLRAITLLARRRRDGLDWYAEVDATPVANDLSVAAIVILRDVSIRTELENDLELARNQLAVALETHRARQLADSAEVALLLRQWRSSVQAVLPHLSHLAVDPRLPDDARQSGRQLLANAQLQSRLMRIWPGQAATQSGLASAMGFEIGSAVILTERTDIHALLGATLRHVSIEGGQPVSPLPVLRLSATSYNVTGDPARLRQLVWNLIDSCRMLPSRSPQPVISTHSTAHSLVLQLSDARGLHAKAVELCSQLAADEQATWQYGPGKHGAGSNVCAVDFRLSTSLTASDDPAVRPATPSPYRVLFVEDDATRTRVLSKLFSRSGYDVVSVTSAQQASEAAATAAANTSGFDLVLCELSSSPRVGDTIAMMRQLRDTHGLIGVAMTSELRGAQELADAGFVDQILRPVDLKLLSLLVDRLRITRDSRPT